MRKTCNTCKYWKKYKKLEDNCLCQIHSRGNTDIYTSPNDICGLWIRRKQLHYKKFRDTIKIKTKIG
jgi:hypothetical protein